MDPFRSNVLSRGKDLKIQKSFGQETTGPCVSRTAFSQPEPVGAARAWFYLEVLVFPSKLLQYSFRVPFSWKNKIRWLS